MKDFFCIACHQYKPIEQKVFIKTTSVKRQARCIGCKNKTRILKSMGAK